MSETTTNDFDVVITIHDPGTLALIAQALANRPESLTVTQVSPPPALPTPVEIPNPISQDKATDDASRRRGWDREAAETLVDNLTAQCLQLFSLIVENDGRISLDAAAKELGLSRTNKALGGVMSSKGKGMRILHAHGRTDLIDPVHRRDSGEFHEYVLDERALKPIRTAVRRRMTLESDRQPAAVA